MCTVFGACTKIQSCFAFAGKGPPNASAVASAVVGDPVDSQLRVYNNGFKAMAALI